MLAVYKRELQGYFLAPLGYIFIGIYMLMAGLFFVLIDVGQGSADYVSILGYIWFQFLIIMPLSILTMKLLSDERKNKTDQLLLTSPLSITAMVMGKYLAAVTVFLVTLIVSLLFPLILSMLGNPPIIEIFAGYLGFFLMGCALISVGLFISALTENQVVSAVATFGVLLALWLLGKALIPVIQVGWIVNVLQWLSVFDRLTPFTQGLLSVTQVIYFISFAAVFIFLAIRTVESRRWSEV
jgi:ABC-2 type transport system permease protein